MTRVDEPLFPLPEGEPGRSDQLPGTVPGTAPAGDPGGHRRPVEPDAVCSAAVAVARAAAEDLAGPGEVGDHLGVLAEGDRLVAHYFRCLAKGYRGWRWAITVARAPRSRTASVCETVLLPGDDAVLAPAWVPWSDRLAPGDLGTTDVLPYREDDPLLVPGYTQTGDAQTGDAQTGDAVVGAAPNWDDTADRHELWELGLGRVRVLGPLGRDEAAARWYHGDRGPTADEAVHAAAACSTCGYFLPLAGALRQAFGVCANEWSPSDARVVSVDHGCGAHSETDVERPEPLPLPEPILDETGAEAIVLPPPSPGVPAVATDSPNFDSEDAGPDDVIGEPGESGGPGEPGEPGERVPGPTGQDTQPIDAPGSDPVDGPPDEGEPLPGESPDTPLLVGEGIAPIEVTLVPITTLFDVGPAAKRHGGLKSEPEP